MSNTIKIEKESKPNQVDNVQEATVSETIADNTTNTKEIQDEPVVMPTVEEVVNEPTTTISQEPAQQQDQQQALQQSQQQAQESVEQVDLPENVRILKEAFPDTDVEVIEAVLQTQNDNLESTFEILLGMSDPNYSVPSVPAPESHPVAEEAPPMPPRPQSRQNSSDAPYAYWERQAQPKPTSVEEQLRMDEELAKRLAMEDERNSQQRN
jgi:hypothetical protein